MKMLHLYFLEINKIKNVDYDDMNLVSWTKEKRGFYMSKLTYEDKINSYTDS